MKIIQFKILIFQERQLRYSEVKKHTQGPTVYCLEQIGAGRVTTSHHQVGYSFMHQDARSKVAGVIEVNYGRGH